MDIYWIFHKNILQWPEGRTNLCFFSFAFTLRLFLMCVLYIRIMLMHFLALILIIMLFIITHKLTEILTENSPHEV